jgi:hypothetical protein
MACLGAKCYDPATAVSKATTSAIAMTALDTTNLRIVFNVPSTGRVWVRLQGTVHGATTFPQILMGVMEGSTVVARVSPIGNLKGTALATTHMAVEASFVIEGLTSAQQKTWDAAYGVETLVAATGLKYGGPNNTTANDAFGAFLFEVWEA